MSAPFLIDAATGRVRFPDLALELAPGMPQAEFLAATARFNRDNLGANDGWQRYTIGAPISGERKLGMFFVFLNGRLTMWSFAYAPKNETWDDWSEATEQARLKEYEQELATQLGARSEFPWGTAKPVLDSKNGGTDVWIDYREPAAR